MSQQSGSLLMAWGGIRGSSPDIYRVRPWVIQYGGWEGQRLLVGLSQQVVQPHSSLDSFWEALPVKFTTYPPSHHLTNLLPLY